MHCQDSVTYFDLKHKHNISRKTHQTKVFWESIRPVKKILPKPVLEFFSSSEDMCNDLLSHGSSAGSDGMENTKRHRMQFYKKQGRKGHKVQPVRSSSAVEKKCSQGSHKEVRPNSEKTPAVSNRLHKIETKNSKKDHKSHVTATKAGNSDISSASDSNGSGSYFVKHRGKGNHFYHASTTISSAEDNETVHDAFDTDNIQLRATRNTQSTEDNSSFSTSHNTSSSGSYSIHNSEWIHKFAKTYAHHPKSKSSLSSSSLEESTPGIYFGAASKYSRHHHGQGLLPPIQQPNSVIVNGNKANPLPTTSASLMEGREATPTSLGQIDKAVTSKAGSYETNRLYQSSNASQGSKGGINGVNGTNVHHANSSSSSGYGTQEWRKPKYGRPGSLVESASSCPTSNDFDTGSSSEDLRRRCIAPCCFNTSRSRGRKLCLECHRYLSSNNTEYTGSLFAADRHGCVGPGCRSEGKRELNGLCEGCYMKLSLYVRQTQRHPIPQSLASDPSNVGLQIRENPDMTWKDYFKTPI